MPERSEYPKSSMHNEDCEFTCSLVGAAASALTIPATTVVPAADNFALSSTRSAVGVHAIIYKEHFPRVLHVIPTIVSTDGAPKHAVVTSVVEATKTINIKVWSLARTQLSGSATSSDPAEILAGATGTATLAVTGAEVGDTVFVHPRALADGLVVESYLVSSANVVTITLFNPTAGAINDDAQIYDYWLVKNVALDLATTDTLKLTVRARKTLD